MIFDTLKNWYFTKNPNFRWRWIKSIRLSATLRKIQVVSNWQTGPTFLLQQELSWHVECNLDSTEIFEELRLHVINCKNNQIHKPYSNVPNEQSFSKWNRLLNDQILFKRAVHFQEKTHSGKWATPKKTLIYHTPKKNATISKSICSEVYSIISIQMNS